MKKVLIITYYFPPSGGPGVQRVLKFVKYLPQFGWEPVVLTVKNGDYPARDESLLEEIPRNLKVYRTTILEPYNLYRKLTGKPAGAAVDVDNIPKKGEKKGFVETLAEFVRSTFFIPDARVGWLATAVKEAKRIVEQEHIDVVHSSSPPYTCALIARKIKKSMDIPWVAGFRDPWTGFLSTPDRWQIPKKIDEYLERSCYEDADRVEVAWRGIMFDLQKKYPEIQAEKAVHLPNGFDSEDFPPISYRRNEKFTVTYAGSMYGVRNPRSFLRSVANLIATGKVDSGRILLKFIGRFGTEIQQMFREPTVAPCIQILPYLPHAESIRHLLTSEVSLLVVDEYPGGEEIVPGKVFEYIGARRPIIAIAAEGAIAEIIRATNSGRVANHNDIRGIENIFLEYYDDYLYNNSAFAPNDALIAQYERREITRKLAQVFDELTNLSHNSPSDNGETKRTTART